MSYLSSTFEESQPQTAQLSYPVLTKIGSSSNSIIYSVNTDQSLVCKTTCHSCQKHSIECSHLLNEFNILQKCQHPNIIRLVKQNETTQKLDSMLNKKNYCYIFLEKADCDLLAQLSAIYPKVLELSYIKYCFHKIASALQYIHQEKKIAHNDVKLENIFLFGSEPKLADFGFASHHQSDPVKQAKSYTHRSKKNLAPEINYNIAVLEINSSELQAFDERKADSFGFGVALFNALFHKNPFDKHAHHKDAVYSLLGSEDFWKVPQTTKMLDFISEFNGSQINDLKNLFEGLLHSSPSRRLSFKEILNHPWFTGDFQQ